MDSKYLNIYNEIMSKIENGIFEPYQKLPSEHELMEEYNVSRDTIRKSLNMLEQQGYIQKAKGRGSFVLDTNKFNFPVSGVTSFKELANKIEKKSNTIVEEFELIAPDEKLRKRLNIEVGEKVWKILRVRDIDDEKIILDKDYIVEKYVPNLTKEICEDSIYEYIENQLGLRIGFAKKEITVGKTVEKDKNYLDMSSYDTIVVVKSYTYLEDASLFQYTESRHRPDRFKFVDFARRTYQK